MTTTKQQAQKNEQTIKEFFTQHTGANFWLYGTNPNSPTIQDRAFQIGTTEQALDRALGIAKPFTGWIMQTMVRGGDLYIVTRHPKSLEKITEQVKISCPFNDDTETCVTCGTQMDAEMLAYELGQEAAQAERMYA